MVKIGGSSFLQDSQDDKQVASIAMSMKLNKCFIFL